MRRRAEVSRKTKETQISLSLELDGSGKAAVETGLGFFDHMLTHLAFHGLMDLSLKAQGDLEVDPHHTVEDVGICLGQALAAAIGEKKGIVRYGSALVPMDEALMLAVVDFSGRPLSLTDWIALPGEAGGLTGQLAEEFLRALALHGGLTIHLRQLSGRNDHHILEASFKALGRALDQASALDPRRGEVTSTKGTL